MDGIVVFGLLSQMQGTERFRKLGIPVVETWDLSGQAAHRRKPPVFHRLSAPPPTIRPAVA